MNTKEFRKEATRLKLSLLVEESVEKQREIQEKMQSLRKEYAISLSQEKGKEEGGMKK